MQIVQITPSYKPSTIYGGPTLSVSHLCEELTENNVDVRVYTTTANGINDLLVTTGLALDIEGVSCIYYPRWTGDHSHFSPRLLYALFHIPKGQIVHIHSWWNLVVIPAVFICWLRGIRPILSPRGMLSPYTLKSLVKRVFHSLVGRWLLSHTILHATSEQELKEALALIPNWPHFVLPNIIDLPAIGSFETPHAPKENCQLVFLSRVHPKKGLETLFEALSSLTFPWTLQIIGEGATDYIKTLKQLSQENGIESSIEWIGWREGSEKFNMLARADLFVLPSQNENFANVVLESLVVGTPVIISEQVGLSSYVNEKELGWTYSGSANELATCIHQAWFNTTQRERIRCNAPAQVHKDFGATVLAHKYIEAYNEYAPTV